MSPRLVLNLQSSCLSHPGTGVMYAIANEKILFLLQSFFAMLEIEPRALNN
jgi:hypothetical protein